MKQLTGPQIAGRILEVQLSQRDEKFTPRDSRTWRKIADKILTAISDYDEPVQALYDEQEEVALNGDLSDGERQDELRRINREIRGFDEAEGQEPFTLWLEETEYSFLNVHWWQCKFPADRKTAVLTEAVSAMLESAVEVTQVDGAWVPVEAKAAPTAINGRGAKRRATLGRR